MPLLEPGTQSPSQRDAYWLGWLLLASTLIPGLVWRFEWLGWAVFAWSNIDGGLVVASVFLLCAGFAHLLHHGYSATLPTWVAVWLGRSWWFVLISTWMLFWLDDLRHARFASTLLAIPASVVGASIGLVFGRPRPARALIMTALAIGVAVGLGIVWSLMVPRSDNGCTGVSRVYERTQLITLFALYLLGPQALLPYLRRLPRP